MRVGYFSTNTAEGIRPEELAVELEQRGFDSLWLPEHSHIPVERRPTKAFGTEVPEAYVHLMDPFVSLAAAAAVTTDLRLGTGVAMVLEHDLLDLASRVATLDVLTRGRLHFGVAVGWLPEELANHRPDLSYADRYDALAERIEALRIIWTDEEPEFHGHWERFTRSWVYPKPVQRPLPVGFGFSGARGIGLAAALADEWYPIDLALGPLGGVRSAIERFRVLAEEAGRDADTIPITVFAWGWAPGEPPLERLAGYAELGIERVVVTPPTTARHDRDTTRRRLDELSPLVALGAQ